MGKVKETLEMMPASVNSYIAWIMSDKLHMDDDEMKSYNYLVNELIKIPFRYIHPMDENRLKDGLELRSDFEYETGKFLDGNSGIPPVCSFFEMIVALACRCENQLMRNFEEEDNSKKWFYIMLKNLGLDGCTNENWRYENVDLIKNRVNLVMNREKSPDGTVELFPLKSKNLKNEEIWKQCMAYLRENFTNENEENLELYSL